MTLLAEYRGARRDEDSARLRRVLALRAMAAAGMSQRAIAAALGITRPAVSQQLKAGRDLADAHREARPDSDIDLIVEAPAGTSTFGFLDFKRLVEQVLGREVDLVEYGGLAPKLDDDILRAAVLL